MLKHAAASEVRISLSLESDALVLSIEDNGKGFNLPNDSRTRGDADEGCGLVNMRQRLAEIGGVCEIQSSPSAGTKVRFTVPFKTNSNA